MGPSHNAVNVRRRNGTAGFGSCECDSPWLPVSRGTREKPVPLPICRTRSMTLGLKRVHRYRGVFRSRSCFTLLPVPMHRSGALDNGQTGSCPGTFVRSGCTGSTNSDEVKYVLQYRCLGTSLMESFGASRRQVRAAKRLNNMVGTERIRTADLYCVNRVQHPSSAPSVPEG